jgi:hypothetical protein
MRSKLLGIGLVLALLAAPMANAIDTATPDNLPVVSVMSIDTPNVDAGLVPDLAMGTVLLPLGASVLADAITTPVVSARSTNAVAPHPMSANIAKRHAPIVAEVGGWPSSNG